MYNLKNIATAKVRNEHIFKNKGAAKVHGIYNLKNIATAKVRNGYIFKNEDAAKPQKRMDFLS